MSRYEHGRILAVNETTLGSELVGDHAQGVGSLTVDDPVDFDEDGGWLKIADQVVEYSTYDDDTGEITLVGTLDAAAGEGDRVFVWDGLFQAVTTDLIAQVQLDGDDDNTDPLEATVALHLVDRLVEGIRSGSGESVLLELDGDEWRVVDVLGLSDSIGGGGGGGRLPAEDVHIVGALGDQTIELTHEPIPPSEHLYVMGQYQPSSEWTRDGRTITLPDPDGILETGWRIWVEYLYRPGDDAINDQPPATDPPWWQDDPSLGCTSGYPVETDAEKVNVNLGTVPSTVRYVRAELSGSISVINPAIEWGAWVVYTHPGQKFKSQPGHDGDARYTVTTSPESPVYPNGYRIGFLNLGAGETFENLVSVTPGSYADVDFIDGVQAEAFAETEIIGVVIAPEGTDVASWHTPQDWDGSTGYPYLGVSNGSRCTFWIGDPIADYVDPSDTGGEATPYRSLS